MNDSTTRATARTWAGLAVLVLPMLLIAIDSMVLIFALAEITAELTPSGAEQLWILDIYSLMLAGLLVTMASLGDRFGRRRVLLIGAVFFAIASVMGALSTEPWMLIAARALLGVSGAAIMPGTLSLIRTMFADRDQRRTAMAVWAAMGALGAAAGPIVGGWIIETFSWHAAFLMNIPVMVLLLVLAPFLVPESRYPNPGRIDPPSILLSLAGTISLIYGVKTLAEGKEPVVALVTFVAGLALLALFVVRQLRMPIPMINVRLFRVRAFTGAVVINQLSVFALVGAMFALTQFLQLIAGLSIISSALWMLPPGRGLGPGRFRRRRPRQAHPDLDHRLARHADHGRRLRAAPHPHPDDPPVGHRRRAVSGRARCRRGADPHQRPDHELGDAGGVRSGGRDQQHRLRAGDVVRHRDPRLGAARLLPHAPGRPRPAGAPRGGARGSQGDPRRRPAVRPAAARRDRRRARHGRGGLVHHGPGVDGRHRRSDPAGLAIFAGVMLRGVSAQADLAQGELADANRA